MNSNATHQLGGTMSEQQVLPELIATLKAAAQRSMQGVWERAGLSILADRGTIAKCPTPREDGVFDCNENAEYIARASPENILKLIASLAQSEAERERLQGEVEKWKNIGMSSGHLWRAEVEKLETRCESLLASGTKAAEELARERELSQGLRQVVKEYREDDRDHLGTCRTNVFYPGLGPMDDRCPLCKQADALLEDKAKPVATNAGEGHDERGVTTGA
jgi:hypothetical protein